MGVTFAVLALLTAPALAPRCTPQFAPLAHTASYSGDSDVPFWRASEAGKWRGTGWLGWSGDADRLRPVRVRVTPRPKVNPNDEDEVHVTTAPLVEFAVRCVAGLTEGRIVNVQRFPYELAHHEPLQIALGARKYEIRLDARETTLADARVVLTEGRRTQVLYDAEGFVDEPHFEIVWAGDLDRDGKLDLVVNLDRKYSWYPIKLLLSSRATGKNLVGLAALFETGD